MGNGFSDPKDPYVMQCKITKMYGIEQYERYYVKCSQADPNLLNVKYEVWPDMCLKPWHALGSPVGHQCNCNKNYAKNKEITDTARNKAIYEDYLESKNGGSDEF